MTVVIHSKNHKKCTDIISMTVEPAGKYFFIRKAKKEGACYRLGDFLNSCFFLNFSVRLWCAMVGVAGEGNY